MQTRESIQVKVGLFIFSGVVVAMITIFLLGGERQLFNRQYVLRTFFEDISGLRTGAQVQLAGVRVGLVDRISLGEKPGKENVEIRLTIDRDFQSRIRRDSLASVTTLGLLGDKIVSVSLGSPDREVLKDGDVLPSEERPSLFAIAEKGGLIMENINKAAKTISDVLEEVEKGRGLLHTLIYESRDKPVSEDFAQTAKELRGASKDLREILERVKQGQGTVGALLTDQAVYNDIRRLFGKLERNRLLRNIMRSRIRDLELEKTYDQRKSPWDQKSEAPKSLP